ncbi:MAG: VOC family protein [Caldilineaceae bacterium]|nr:VOC family protein [Caldilineaceae bacterium]
MTNITPFLMFDDQLEEAVTFYAATFPDSEIRHLTRSGDDSPLISAEFTIGGRLFMGYNGGSHFRFSDAFSLFVECADQAEVDEYWDKLLAAGATPVQCGWITDPFGVSWQIVPRRFMELMGDENPRKVQAVMNAMLQMVKFDVAALEEAYANA